MKNVAIKKPMIDIRTGCFLDLMRWRLLGRTVTTQLRVWCEWGFALYSVKWCIIHPPSVALFPADISELLIFFAFIIKWRLFFFFGICVQLLSSNIQIAPEKHLCLCLWLCSELNTKLCKAVCNGKYVSMLHCCHITLLSYRFPQYSVNIYIAY